MKDLQADGDFDLWQRGKVVAQFRAGVRHESEDNDHCEHNWEEVDASHIKAWMGDAARVSEDARIRRCGNCYRYWIAGRGIKGKK